MDVIPTKVVIHFGNEYLDSRFRGNDIVATSPILGGQECPPNCYEGVNKIEIESFILVTVQFLCIVFFFYFALATPLSLLSIIIITIAIAVALWSIFTMHFGNLRIQPIPKDDAKLVMNGPYRFIRHPMYTAVLLGMLSIAISINSLLAYAVWLILLIDLYIKLRFEEKLLIGKFPEYQEYMKKTSRLLPFLKL